MMRGDEETSAAASSSGSGALPKLAGVIFVKIILTVFWGGALLGPACLQHSLGLPSPGPEHLFVRLLGVAYASLLVVYRVGFVAARRGQYPEAVVWAGIVSNGGACATLAFYHASWEHWDKFAPALMWASLAATGLTPWAWRPLAPEPDHHRRIHECHTAQSPNRRSSSW